MGQSIAYCAIRQLSKFKYFNVFSHWVVLNVFKSKLFFVLKNRWTCSNHMQYSETLNDAVLSSYSYIMSTNGWVHFFQRHLHCTLCKRRGNRILNSHVRVVNVFKGTVTSSIKSHGPSSLQPPFIPWKRSGTETPLKERMQRCLAGWKEG